MRHRSWESYSEQAESGPWGAFKIVLLGLFIMTVMGIGCSVVGYGLGWFGDAAAVAKKELAPSELLRKYSWFKDAAAACDAKLASLQVYERRFQDMKDSYSKTPRSQWPREDREQWNLWTSEVAGIAASYNTLAADYNAQMSKIQWRFTNVGDLPAGATVPLPREFKPYQTGAR